mmetsp:Transcript_11207/g.19187  ORF Transcript_11207/g.19187 Transcript_11207/m.19187 type:complete len:532 (+) Transcript_11207:42-1637(+)
MQTRLSGESRMFTLLFFALSLCCNAGKPTCETPDNSPVLDDISGLLQVKTSGLEKMKSRATDSPVYSTATATSIRGARSLQAELCKGKAGSSDDFKQMRLDTMKLYEVEFQKSEDVAVALGAVLELEECGVEAEKASRSGSDPARSEAVRQDLSRELHSVHQQHKAEYEKARTSLTSMMKRRSDNGRLFRQVSEEVGHGHWVMAQESAKTCVETCSSVGEWCDVQMMENLDSREAVQAAVQASGGTCSSFEEMILYTAWDGPWTEGNRCAFSPFAFTDCTMRVNSGFHRVCACTSTEGPSKAQPRRGMFEHILPALPLPDKLVRKGSQLGDEDRDVVGPQTLSKLGSECIAYTFGVAYELGYERSLTADYGCTVHAFDCTMLDGKRLMEYLNLISGYPNLVFHPWCIGEHKSTYAGWENQTTGVFLGLEEVMTKLGHKAIDLLKFDIEGNEWALFDTLLKTRKDLLPHQLAFEIHTYGAQHSAVPQDLVGDKGERETAELFNRLYDAGYMLTSKAVNVKDPSCAEMLMVRM